MPAVRVDGEDAIVEIKVVPGASRTRVAGLLGDRVKIAVAAPPEKGKANATLIAYLAGLCKVHKRDVVVESGLTSPAKTVRIRGVSADVVSTALHLT